MKLFLKTLCIWEALFSSHEIIDNRRTIKHTNNKSLRDQVNFVWVQLCWGVFYRILQGKILTILLFTSCAPTKFTWSSLGTINISKIDKNVLSWFLNGWRKILVTYVYLCYKLWYNILCLTVLRCMIACACSRTRRALIKHF